MGQTQIPLELALEELLHRTSTPEGSETLTLLGSLGRRSFGDLRVNRDVPPFDSSPVDGFALCHRELLGVSRDKPGIFQVRETIYAGDAPAKPLRKGECVRIMTGAPIPGGATCVIPYEDTDNGKDYVQIPLALGEHQNYRFQGEDLHQGQGILSKGERITAAHIGVLASQGSGDILVFMPPKVGILSTGSELISGDQALGRGKIYDSNRYSLGARVLALGGEPVFGPSTADDPHIIAETLEGLLKTCDLIVTTGGVSVGDHDYMPLVGEMLRAEQLFRGVQMKPGGWITAFYRDTKLILCLSGNPGAAAISFDLLAMPVICRLAGSAHPLHRRIPALLGDPFPKASTNRRFLYARQEMGIVSIAPSSYASSSLSSLMGGNCILDIPPGTPPLPAGAQVEIILL